MHTQHELNFPEGITTTWTFCIIKVVNNWSHFSFNCLNTNHHMDFTEPNQASSHFEFYRVHRSLLVLHWYQSSVLIIYQDYYSSSFQKICQIRLLLLLRMFQAHFARRSWSESHLLNRPIASSDVSNSSYFTNICKCISKVYIRLFRISFNLIFYSYEKLKCSFSSIQYGTCCCWVWHNCLFNVRPK